MTDAATSEPGFAANRRPAAARFFVIAALTGLAIAQPILDLFGDSPATFQVNRIRGANIAAFGIGIVLVPAVGLWLAGEVAARLSRIGGQVAHLGAVAGLASMFGVIVGKDLVGNAAGSTLIGLAIGGAVTAGYVRFGAVGTWLRLLSAANLLFLGQFLFFSPVADAISSEEQELVDFGVELVDPPSVYMIVFDEWSTQTILREDELIDEIRFPNLAAFADDATWYRHFSVVSPFTQSAVPALLDGLDPQGDSTWRDHPDSLFTLLAPSHHLTVSEVITEVCGLPGCGPRPVPPPSEADAPNPPTVVSSADPRWGNLLRTVREAWTERIRPGSNDGVDAFDDFVEELAPAAEPVEAIDPNAALGEDDAALLRYLATLVDQQPSRQQAFLEALQPTDQPVFGFVHLILPHQPWSLYPDGTLYDVAADRFDFEADHDDPWPARVGRQRHFLQAQYADRLLGQLIARLKAIDEYDDSIVVVAADHGVSFEPGVSSRRVTDEAIEQVAYAPLLIKAPGQTDAVISDDNVNSTDLVPTIADLLGTDVPWPVDGLPIGSPALAERGTTKYIHSFTDAFSYEFLGVVEYDDATSWAELRRGLFPALRADDDPLAALYAGVPGAGLIGSSAESVFVPGGGEVEVAALDRLREPPDDDPLLAEIAGRLIDPPDGATVVVAINDSIVGVSPLYVRGDEPGNFVVLVANGALGRATNAIRIGLLADDGSVRELDAREGG